MADPKPLPTIMKRTCKSCGKSESQNYSLKQCGHCGSVIYCSSYCQKVDWWTHKNICLSTPLSRPPASVVTQNKVTPAVATTSTTASTRDIEICGLISGLGAEIKTPFTRLVAKRWLHGQTEKDAFKLLIDTIRVRSWDDQYLAAQSLMDIVQVSKMYATRMLLVRFLKEADCKGLLPGWWSLEKEKECVNFALGDKNNKTRSSPLQGYQVIAHYRGGPLILLQMRMFAEQVYGVVFGKQSVMPELEAHMERERQELLENLQCY